MKELIFKYISVGCGTAVLVMSGCTKPTETAATETTNGTVHGIVRDNDQGGAIVAGAAVHLYQEDYNPMESDLLPDEWQTTTNDNGEYTLTKVTAGRYNIQSWHPDGDATALLRNIEASGEPSEVVEAEEAVLKNPGVITVSLYDMSFEEDGRVYLPGTNIYSEINAETMEAGVVTLSGVPEGVYPQLKYSAGGGDSVLDLDADVNSADTTLVSMYQAWEYKFKVIINTSPSGADITGGLIDFPLLVRLDTVVQYAQSDGSDLRFTNSNGVPLAYEIERWEAAQKRADVWVKVDTIHGNNSGQHIYMYMGKSDASDSSNSQAVFDIANAFGGVWHLNEDPNGDPVDGIKDRTANANHGAPGGNMTSDNLVDGMVGQGIRLDNDDDPDDYIDINDGGLTTDAGTVSLWGRPDAFTTSNRYFFAHTSITTDFIDKILIYADPNGWLTVAWGQNASITEIHQLTAATWYHIAATWNDTSGTGDGLYQVYVNGALDTSGTYTDLDEILNADIGNTGCPGCTVNRDRPLDGVMDEVRVDNAVRSASWIKMSYENQAAGSTVVTIEN